MSQSVPVTSPAFAVRNPALRAELLHRMEADQAIRQRFLEWMQQNHRADVEALKSQDFPVARQMRAIDRDNTERMKRIVERYGWPGKSLVGQDGANAAWLLVQHADQDRAFQRRCLALMSVAAARGEVSKTDFAYLEDRVRVAENKPQRYGTQTREVNGKQVPDPIEDEAHVDARRAEAGMPPLANYLQLVNTMMHGREKFILDTDIGDDIDDAYALALLASWPEAELLGVTTTFGQTHERAELAAKLLSVMGHSDVPVCAGRRGASPIRRQYDWARGFRGSNVDPGDAVAFLKREIDRYPGKITLIGIGPLVNLGDLLTRYPEEKRKIKRIVIMGGAVFVGYNNQAPPTPEWNILCDPAAARVVFNSGVPLVMAGLEVTTMMQFDAERQKRLFAYGTPLTDALAALTNLWGNGTPTLFDVVAVGYALGHGFCDEEPHHVEVDANGLTRITDGPPNVTVLVHPHKEAFLDWYIASLAPLVQPH
jgi:inosine-uridine nucleoside N-ribohydrolase